MEAPSPQPLLVHSIPLPNNDCQPQEPVIYNLPSDSHYKLTPLLSLYKKSSGKARHDEAIVGESSHLKRIKPESCLAEGPGFSEKMTEEMGGGEIGGVCIELPVGRVGDINSGELKSYVCISAVL